MEKVAVIGAGTMGQGIAQIMATAGHKTILYDINNDMLSGAVKAIEKNLDKAVELGKLTTDAKAATLNNLETTSDIKLLVADIFIEAIVEKRDVKVKLFQQLEEQNATDAIFATNTSSIPITQIAAGLKHPERVVGMHFFNPAHIMKLVEVISGAATSPEIADKIKQLALKLNKVPVMTKDSPGFIVNRVARHYYVEALKVLEEQAATVEQIDNLMEASGFKMGPFKLMDLIGVDTNFSVTTAMFESFHYDPKFRPNRIQQQKVDAGHWGRKKGKGFYEY